MTRKKVKLAFITNDSARKATFKKRKKGLMKKVSELSTLCGIGACAIVYSPYESQPEVWPDARGAQLVVGQFKRMPEMEQSKKMVNQESFTRHRIAKATDQLKKLSKDNREKEVTQLMYQCLTGKGLHGLAVPELNDMGWLLDQNLKEIYKRIEGLKSQQQQPAAAHDKGSTSTTTGVLMEQKTQEMENNGGGGGVDVHKQWFTEWMGGSSAFGGGVGGRDHHEIIMPFSDHHANAGGHPTMWSNVFFP